MCRTPATKRGSCGRSNLELQSKFHPRNRPPSRGAPPPLRSESAVLRPLFGRRTWNESGSDAQLPCLDGPASCAERIRKNGDLPRRHLHVALSRLSTFFTSVDRCGAPLSERRRPTQNEGPQKTHSMHENVAEGAVGTVYGIRHRKSGRRRKLLRHRSRLFTWRCSESRRRTVHHSKIAQNGFFRSVTNLAAYQIRSGGLGTR